MSKPRVTITLGRSGQVVVKDPPPPVVSGGCGTDSKRLSGRKRSTTEIFESHAHYYSSFSTNKRLRGNVTTRSEGYSQATDAHIRQNGLQLKLMRKRTSRRKPRKVEEHVWMDLFEKMSRPIQSPVGLEKSLLKRVPSTERKGNINQVQPMSSSNSTDASRTGQLLGCDFFQLSMSEDPAPITMRATLEDKPVTEFPPASCSMQSSSYLGEQPPTVSSLLNSLGLGKYDILFHSEEVDMEALKRMEDCDLKELGLPMGPRKKILFAILSLAKQKP